MPAHREPPSRHDRALTGSMHRPLFWLAYVLIWAALLTVSTTVSAQASPGLRAQYEQLAPKLAESPFRRPLLLSSADDGAHPAGEMHAVLSHPFGTLSQALRQPAAWCELMTLPENVKRCLVGQDAKRSTQLTLAIGRKSDQPIADAHEVAFRFQVAAAQPHFLLVEMQADKGPMGTSDYRLTLEAVPIDAKRSFIRMRYAYANNLAARLATRAYLATAGRDKVGFTITGRDSRGEPRYVGGIQGIAERNTMRYFLAMESYLDTLTAPEDERLERRLRDWYLATERYARQLHELSMDDYLAMKRKDAAQRVASADAE